MDKTPTHHTVKWIKSMTWIVLPKLCLMILPCRKKQLYTLFIKYTKLSQLEYLTCCSIILTSHGYAWLSWQHCVFLIFLKAQSGTQKGSPLDTQIQPLLQIMLASYISCELSKPCQLFSTIYITFCYVIHHHNISFHCCADES